MKVLVTGATGFIARHLIRHYLAEEIHPVAWSRQVPPEEWISSNLTWQSLDMLDAESVMRALESAQPDYVFHLSAQSLPGVSWEDPNGTFDANVIATVNLLMALRACAAPSRLILVSSSSVYAPNPGDRPIREDDPTGGVSVYAVSKLAQEMTARLWGRKYGIPIMMVRPFFVIGPGKEGDVCADFAHRVVRAEREKQAVIRVGNLDAVRDFVDVADAVRALRLLAEQGDADGVYNLARGTGWAIRKVLECYRTLSAVPLEVEPDRKLMRQLDEPIRIGDSSKLQALGWQPQVRMEESLKEILAYWRETK